MAVERLQKILASCGIDSRRGCEQLILDGSVCVNGRVVDCLPAFADPDRDVITVEGRRIRQNRKVYFLLNKPRGVTCASSLRRGRKGAIDMVPCREQIFCVGRLEDDCSGLIILTNDSELAGRMSHPRYGVAETCIVRAAGQVDGRAIEKLKRGVWLAEGRAAASQIKLLKRGRTESLLEITIQQGINRQVSRMLARVGLDVKSLKKTKIGKINSKGLGVGKFRPLSPAEIAYLKRPGKIGTKGGSVA